MKSEIAMTQRQTSMEALKKDYVKQHSMRQNSMENHSNKRRQYTQQSSVLSKIWPYVSKRINILIGVLLLSVVINMGLVLGFVFMIVNDKSQQCPSSSGYPNHKESICLPCDFIKQADTMLGAYVEGPHNTARGRHHKSDHYPVHSPTDRTDVCCMDVRTGLRVLMERVSAQINVVCCFLQCLYT